MVLSFLAIGLEAKAATTYTQYNFNSSLSGPQSWSTTTNWTPNASPGTTVTSGTNTGYAYITAASGALNVTTPSSATLVGGVFLTASSGNAVTLTLGNDLTLDTIASAQPGAPYTAGSYTNTGASSDLNIDLKGYTYNAIRLSNGNNYGAAPTIGPTVSMTIKSSGSAGGTFVTDNYGAGGTGAMDIQDNATVYVRAPASAGLNTVNTTFSATSTFQFQGGGSTAGSGGQNLVVKQSPAGNQAFGNLIIGDNSASKLFTNAALTQNQQLVGGVPHIMVVRGNMTLVNNADGIGRVNLSLGSSYSNINVLQIGGNYRDEGGSVQSYTTTGQYSAIITMNGGTTERTMSVNRTINTTGTTHTDFTIGDATSAGNTKMSNYSSSAGALYTSGSMTVYNGSRLNLDHSTTTGSVASLKAGSIIIGETSTAGSV
ncbi:MAG: hypothetical protein ABIP97_14370, partial [Chthoniobacterales bacterium]